jgi:hypothetical protein
MLNVVMLNVIMLSVVLLCVAAPYKTFYGRNLRMFIERVFVPGRPFQPLWVRPGAYSGVYLGRLRTY